MSFVSLFFTLVFLNIYVLIAKLHPDRLNLTYFSVQTDFTAEKKYHLRECSEYISLNLSGICHELRFSRN